MGTRIKYKITAYTDGGEVRWTYNPSSWWRAVRCLLGDLL